MKNSYKWLVGAGVIVIALCTYKPFSNVIMINDVSKKQVYEIGNNSYIISPVNIRGKISGNVSGDAIVIISDHSIPMDIIAVQRDKLVNESFINAKCIYLNKGNVNKEFWCDYYKDYYRSGPGYIYYVPLGAKQGKIKIDWSI
jgi:hypothetical protein